MLHLVHLEALQQPLTQDMLQGAPCVLRFSMNETRGATAEAEIEIRNPGLAILQSSNYVAIVETDDADGLLANGKVLCRARVAKAPSDLKGLTLTLALTCAPSSHKLDLQAAANAACAGAAIPPWTVRVVPQPDPGVIGVVFTGTPGTVTSWPILQNRALRVTSFFQEDLVRTPYARVSWNVLTVQNALLVLSLPASASAAAYAAAAAKNFAIVGVSGDKDPTHGAFFTYGVVMRCGPAPGGGVDVEVNLADPRITGSGFAYAPGDPTAAGLPFYDPLFGGGSDDLSTTALEGRAQTWHVDPVTHAISLDDLLAGRRVVDLGGLRDEASTEFTAAQSPVRHVKMRISAEWEQRAVGPVDIAPVIATAAGPSGYISSLQDSPVEPKADQKLDFQNWGGWTKGDWPYRSTVSPSMTFPTSRQIAVTYRETRQYVQGTNPDGTVKPPTSVKGEPFTVVHNEYANFNVRQLKYNSAWCSYEYSQPRREVVDLILDVDAQDTALGTDTLELPSITLGDLLNVAGINPYEPTTIYNAGDRVTVFGHAWQCTRDGVIGFLAPVTSSATGIGGLSVDVQYVPLYWRDLGTLAPLSSARAPSFFDTPRGIGCMKHALMRMRAAALKRLEMITVSRTYPWALARDVDLRDRVRMEIRDGETKTVVIGKVIGIDRRVEAVASVKVTIAVPLGTGRNDAVPDKDAGDYGDGDYFGDSYTAVTTSQFLVPQVDGGATGIFSVNGDIEAVSQAAPLSVPVDAFRLGDPWYAVRECYVDWQAGAQVNEALARMASGRDPRSVTQDCPTNLRLSMRFMPPYASIERIYRVHGILTVSPRGIVLARGEP